MIERFADRRVTYLQFANASEWETCLRVDCEAAYDEVQCWLSRFAGMHIGIEAFFSAPELGCGDSFAGVRLPFREETALFCAELVKAYADSNSAFCVSDFTARLDKFGPFFQGGADFIELGAVNMWSSFGPLRFWRRGDGEPAAAFAEALKGAERYQSILPVPAAVEFAADEPAPHWLGLSVSEKVRAGGYSLCEGVIRSCLSLDIMK